MSSDADAERRREYHRQWRQANAEQWTATARAWAERNPEKVREAKRKWREKSKEKIRELNADLYARKKDHVRRYSKAWRAQNKERVAQKSRVWTEANRDRRAANEHKRRARKRGVGGYYTADDVTRMYQDQLGLCLCGADLADAYHVDHKTPLSRGGSNWPDNLQLLCPSCNISKHAKTMDEWAPVKKQKDDRTMSRSEDVKTPLARLAFTDGLFKLQTTQSGKKQWGCSLLFAKGADISALQNAALEAAVAEWGDKAKQMIADKLIHNPFLDGDGPQGKSKQTGEPHAGFPGHTFIRVISGEEYRPKLVNKKVLPVTSKDECYSGCYGYAVVNAFTWENKEKGKGISFGVSMVQVAKDGERLGGGGGGDPTKHFEKIEDSEDAPAETKSGQGAAGLFG